MSEPDVLDELFQRPLDLPDNDAVSAQIVRQVAQVQRRRKVLLIGSGLAGTAVAASVVLWASALPGSSSGVLPTLVSSFARAGAVLGRFMALELLPVGTLGLWALAASSLVAMGLAAARSNR